MNFKKITLRKPVLSMEKFDNSFSDIDIILKFMNINTPEGKTKYVNRMRYRTNPLFGMVIEHNVTISENKVEYSYPELKKANIFYVPTGKYFFNREFMDYGDYYELKKNGELIRIEKIHLKDIVEFCKKNRFINNELLYKLLKFRLLDYSDRDIRLLVENLLENKFLLPELEEKIVLSDISEDGILVRPRLSNEMYYLDLPSNDIVELGNFLGRLRKKRNLKGYYELVEEFIDKYSFRKISILDILKNYNFLNKVNEFISINEYDGSEEWTKFICEHLDAYFMTNDKNYLDIRVKKINFEKNYEYNFDVTVNIIEVKGKLLYNLDTSKPLYRSFSINEEIQENKYSLNFKSENNITNYFLKNKQKKGININYSRNISSDLNLNDLFLTVNEKNREFILTDKDGKQVDISINSPINLKLLDDVCRLLLLVSNIDNIAYNYIPTLIKDYNYIPRLMINRKFIIYREQFVINYNKILFSDISKFRDVLLKTYEMCESQDFSYVISDVEIFVDFNDSNVISFLFKELKKYSILHFKEFIQKDSIIYEKNEHYANEVIISYDVGSNNSKDNFTKLYPIVENPYQRDMLKDWIYLELVLDSFISDVFLSLNSILENDIKFFYLFYINGNNERVLRLRCKGINNFHKITYILSSFKVNNFKILPYEKEICRYYNLGIDNFEKFSCEDSKRILNTLKDCVDFDNMTELEKFMLMLENTVYLFDYFSIAYESRYTMLKKYIKGKEDRDKKKLVKININLNKRKIKHFTNKNYIRAEHLSLIHLSNIRLVGNELDIEREVYKYLAIYYKEEKWRTK